METNNPDLALTTNLFQTSFQKTRQGLSLILTLLGIALFAFIALPVAAQSPNTATIIVTVVDQNDAVVRDANISVVNTATGAVRDAVSRDDTHYSLGSVLNHVLLHQTVIGLEAKEQLTLAGEERPDIYVDW